MIIVKENYKNLIIKTAELLNRDKVGVLPSDTCYGLSCNALKDPLVKMIYKIKQRDGAFPISYYFKNIEQIKHFGDVNNKQEYILRNNLPGPFTFIIEPKEKLALNQPTLGVRLPNEPFIIDLMQIIDYPLTSTSANISKADPCYTINCLISQFSESNYKPDFIVDYGDLFENPPSTVVDITNPDNPIIIRIGSKQPFL
jgi:L-threonylcarbamoyladenylate synthase